MTLLTVLLLYYQMTTNSAVNRNLTSVINNSNKVIKSYKLYFCMIKWIIDMI